MRETIEVATDAHTAIADKGLHGIRDRRSRQLDGQPAAAVDGPVHRDTAPGLARCDGLDDAAGRIEAERLGNLLPGPAKARGRLRANQPGELIRAEPEAAIRIHVPGEAKRMTARSSGSFVWGRHRGQMRGRWRRFRRCRRWRGKLIRQREASRWLVGKRRLLGRRCDKPDHLLLPWPFKRSDQDAARPVGKIESRAATGHQHARQSAETAQALQPRCAARRQATGELSDLPPVHIRGANGLAGQRRNIRRAQDAGAGRVRPQHPRAIARPQPGGKGARRVDQKPWIGKAMQPELARAHDADRAGCSGVCSTARATPAVAEPSVSQAANGRSTDAAARAGDNLRVRAEARTPVRLRR